MSGKKKTKFSGVPINEDFNVKALHDELQRLRKGTKKAGPTDVTLKGYLADSFGPDMTPDAFYAQLGIDLSGGITVDKMLNTEDNESRWLFPEIVRDAIKRGLEYTPIYTALIAMEETVNGTGITMPFLDLTDIDRDEVSLRDVNEGATIPEGEVIGWNEKNVTIRKQARGLKQTYESILFCPINLAAIYFEELGTQMGADLDRALVVVALNGDQNDGSESAPVIGAATANTLLYTDIARAWIRFSRIGRNSQAMLTSEADAITILNLEEFQKSIPANAVAPSGVTLNVRSPLPSSQDIFVHDAVPTGKIIFVDKGRAFVQLTAMPLLIESEKIVSRQVEGQYVSIITGFANIFRDGRLVLDYTTNLTTNPGPTPPSI